MKDPKAGVADANPENRDPITKQAGSHPVGTGIGSAGGAATGAALGAAVSGPIGAVIGGMLGAVVGGAAGHAAGEAANPTVEGDYWSKNFDTRPYYTAGRKYSEYEPAYRFGWESAGRTEYAGRKFAEVESELQRDWQASPGALDPWTDAREATHDAWLRIRGH